MHYLMLPAYAPLSALRSLASHAATKSATSYSRSVTSAATAGFYATWPLNQRELKVVPLAKFDAASNLPALDDNADRRLPSNHPNFQAVMTAHLTALVHPPRH